MAARDGRGCLPASHPEFLHVDWSVSGRLKPEPSNEEEATEEGNFGVRVDVCPRDKSNEIHYNRDPIPMKTGATRDPHWHSRLTIVLQPSPQRLASSNNNYNSQQSVPRVFHAGLVAPSCPVITIRLIASGKKFR
ncbi:hypothetical protein EAG_02673 [Camponotus floridanus]|uniref:Uncharacterized protein n=1 Tax=Camponotus floridanus TaxID=104421 RepID=E1ZYM7_CAMFO|nr:hypothetical protein EAG_02673 [Camponotus floridanus]